MHLALAVSWCVSTGVVCAVDQDLKSGDVNRCGPNALAICCWCLGRRITVDELAALAGNKSDNTSLLDLQSAARAQGLEAVGLRWVTAIPGPWLARAPAIAPVVARYRQPHFVAVVAARDAELLVVDFPVGPSWIPADELRTRWQWDGSLLHIVDDATLAADLKRLGRAPGHRTQRIVLSATTVIVVAVIAAAFLRSRSGRCT